MQPAPPIPEAAAKLVAAEAGRRELRGAAGVLIPLVAGGWSLFQLAIAEHVLLGADIVRCVHLAFAGALVFLCFPAVRGPRLCAWLGDGRWRGLHATRGLFWGDALLAIVFAIAALYLALDATGIAGRQGAPLPRDLFMGATLVVLLLEAARRALGKPLPIVAGLFILYCFCSEWMPGLLASRNASFRKLVNQLTMSTEGIYGIPLDVSASTVFLFVLFGAMLERAGGGHYFIQLAFSLLGRFRGGPAKAAVLASGLTGMVSGSSIANTVTTGTFTIPLMKRGGYPAVKAGAIEVAASTNGQLMPPIMGAAAFIIAEYCGMTYFEVVRAAVIPAFLSYLALLFLVDIEALKLGLKGLPKAELPSFRKTLPGGLHFLIPLGFLLYQLVILRRSAQLAAYQAILALAALIVLHAAWQAWRAGESLPRGLALGARTVWLSLVAGGRNMMAIGVAVAAAGIVVGVVNLGLGSAIVQLIELASMGNLHLMLLITAGVSILLGMGLPTTANYIVMATLTVPVILHLGADMGLVVPVVAAHLFCFYFGILADDTPPVGLSAYAAAAISGADPIRTGIAGFLYDIRTAILPFLFIFNTDLLLVDVHRWPTVLAVFGSGLVAMFAFAALTQGYLRARNRLWESAALLAATLLIMRYDACNAWLPLGRLPWYAIGLSLYAVVHLTQARRTRREGAAALTGNG